METANTKKATVLWVDDEIDLLKVQILFLKSKGYEIETAYNGNDALELVKNNFFDIIFLDENMPGLSGLETLREIILRNECKHGSIFCSFNARRYYFKFKS